MTIHPNTFRTVPHGTAGSDTIGYVVKVVERDGSRFVYFRFPNPWALREGDRRAGWGTTTVRKAWGEVDVELPAQADVDEIIAAIGMPPEAKK